MLAVEKTRDSYQRLFKSCQYIRLSLAHARVEQELLNNLPSPYNENDGVIKKMSVKIENKAKESKTANLQKIKEKIDQQYSLFRTKNTVSELTQNPKQLKDAIKEAFKNDHYGLGRMAFCASIIFDGEYEYQYKDDCIRYLSYELYDDKDVISQLENKIEKIYCKLAKQPLSTKQKWMLFGTAALAISTFVVPQIAFANIASGGSILGGLAAAGNAVGAANGMAAITGIGVLGVGEVLADSALIGITYSAMNGYNKNIVKQSVRDMNCDQIALKLAIKCVLMEHAKEKLPITEYKEQLSELLQMIQDLKSDTDYVFLVENKDLEENRKKIGVFHNLDNVLADSLV